MIVKNNPIAWIHTRRNTCILKLKSFYYKHAIGVSIQELHFIFVVAMKDVKSERKKKTNYTHSHYWKSNPFCAERAGAIFTLCSNSNASGDDKNSKPKIFIKRLYTRLYFRMKYCTVKTSHKMMIAISKQSNLCGWEKNQHAVFLRPF